MNDHMQAFHHTAISVRHLDASLEFYQKLGFVKTNHYQADDNSLHIVQLSLGGVGLEIFWYPSNQTAKKLQLEYANNLEQIGVKHIGLKVKNLDDTRTWLISLGLADENTEINIARSLANSRYLFIQDPDGMWIEFIEDNRPNKEKGGI